MPLRKLLLRTLGLVLAGALLAGSSGCGGRSGPSIERCGDAEIDQTAAFLLATLREVARRPATHTPSSAVAFVTSPLGMAELLPPDPEFEADAAASFQGPRPADSVGFTAGTTLLGVRDKEILLQADDATGVVHAQAYRKGQTGPVHRWTWELD